MAQPEPTAPFEGSEQNLVFALNEVWNVGTLAWVKDEGGGGAGGAVTIADGADVAQGTTSDAAWVSGSGTVISLLKKIASPGGGGLTNTELRATPVPVSGTVTANLAAGTNNIGDVDVLSLPALPAGTNNIGDVDIVTMPAITGIVAVSLTDLTPTAPTAASVGVASAQAVAAAATRKGLILVNTSNARISLGFGAAAVLDSGVTLYPGGVFQMDSNCFDVGAVNAIASAAASNLAIQEYTT